MISYTTQNEACSIFQTSLFCRPMMPKKSRILNSGVKLNASEPYSEIIFTGGPRVEPSLSKWAPFLWCIFVIADIQLCVKQLRYDSKIISNVAMKFNHVVINILLVM